MEAIKKLKQRDSSIELFRIITMLMIVAHHYSVIAEAIAYYVLKLDVHPWYYYVEDSNH